MGDTRACHLLQRLTSSPAYVLQNCKVLWVTGRQSASSSTLSGNSGREASFTGRHCNPSVLLLWAGNSLSISSSSARGREVTTRLHPEGPCPLTHSVKSADSLGPLPGEEESPGPAWGAWLRQSPSRPQRAPEGTKMKRATAGVRCDPNSKLV